MKFMYFQETNSFRIGFGGISPEAITVFYDFIVDLDWEDRVCGIECLGARRHLDIDDIIATPPTFKWITRADDEPVPPRNNALDRYFIHSPLQDTMYIEFALGAPEMLTPVIDGVHAEINAAGVVAGLHIEDASRNLNLERILANGTPTIEWVGHPGALLPGIRI